MHSKLYVAVVLALAHGFAGAASLSEITERALARSPDVQARLHDFLSATQDQEAARDGYLPTLDLETYYGREHLDLNVAPATTLNNPGTNLQLRQILFNGFATRNEVRRLGHTKAARYYDLLATTDDTALEAVRAYLDVHRYRQLSQLAQDNWAVYKAKLTIRSSSASTGRRRPACGSGTGSWPPGIGTIELADGNEQSA